MSFATVIGPRGGPRPLLARSDQAAYTAAEQLFTTHQTDEQALLEAVIALYDAWPLVDLRADGSGAGWMLHQLANKLNDAALTSFADTAEQVRQGLICYGAFPGPADRPLTEVELANLCAPLPQAVQPDWPALLHLCDQTRPDRSEQALAQARQTLIIPFRQRLADWLTNRLLAEDDLVVGLLRLSPAAGQQFEMMLEKLAAEQQCAVATFDPLLFSLAWPEHFLRACQSNNHYDWSVDAGFPVQTDPLCWRAVDRAMAELSARYVEATLLSVD